MRIADHAGARQHQQARLAGTVARRDGDRTERADLAGDGIVLARHAGTAGTGAELDAGRGGPSLSRTTAPPRSTSRKKRVRPAHRQRRRLVGRPACTLSAAALRPSGSPSAAPPRRGTGPYPEARGPAVPTRRFGSAPSGFMTSRCSSKSGSANRSDSAGGHGPPPSGGGAPKLVQDTLPVRLTITVPEPENKIGNDGTHTTAGVR